MISKVWWFKYIYINKTEKGDKWGDLLSCSLSLALVSIYNRKNYQVYIFIKLKPKNEQMVVEEFFLKWKNITVGIFLFLLFFFHFTATLDKST